MDEPQKKPFFVNSCQQTLKKKKKAGRVIPSNTASPTSVRHRGNYRREFRRDSQKKKKKKNIITLLVKSN